MLDKLEIIPDQSSLELTEEIVRARAYQLFEQRGYEHGHDVEDWLIAEAEVTGTKPVAPAKPERSKQVTKSAA